MALCATSLVYYTITHFCCIIKSEFWCLIIWFRYGHMIDNVVLIVTGTLHERDVQELLEKCHPLGMFDRYYSKCLHWIMRAK